MYRNEFEQYADYVDPGSYGAFCNEFCADFDNDISAALATIETIRADGWFDEMTEKLFLIEFEKRHEFDLLQAWKFRRDI